jgi:hypothetical protein
MPNPAAAIRVVGREIAASGASGQNPNRRRSRITTDPNSVATPRICARLMIP